MRYGGNMQNLLRQSHSAAQLGTAIHEALAEFHIFGDEYIVRSFEDANSRISTALGYDPYNHRGSNL